MKGETLHDRRAIDQTIPGNSQRSGNSSFSQKLECNNFHQRHRVESQERSCLNLKLSLEKRLLRILKGSNQIKVQHSKGITKFT